MEHLDMDLDNKKHKITSKEMFFDKERLERQKKKLSILFKKKGLVNSEKAMQIALKYHTGKRKNGFDEVSHQFEIVSNAYALFEYRDVLVLDSIISAIFLHDVVEDYPEKYNFLNLKKDFGNSSLKKIKERNFGDSIFDIVKRMTKTSNFKKTPKDYEKYYKGLEKNPLAVICKLLDRIHNYESMSSRDFQFRIKYFREVDKYLVPMSKRVRYQYPEYEQIITVLIRQLKVLTTFHSELMIAKGELKEGKDYNNPSLS